MKPRLFYANPRVTFAICLILAALTTAATPLVLAGQGRGSPPEPVSDQFVLDAGEACSFPVLITFGGKSGVVNLPNGGMIFTFPSFFITFTNANEPTKSISYMLTGVNHISAPDQNGNTTLRSTGRIAFFDPNYGFVILEGQFRFFVDSTGFVFPPPVGHGRIINVCELID